MAIDLPPNAGLWLPPKPAIIRAARGHDLALVRAARREDLSSRKATFPMPVFMPAQDRISLRASATSTAQTITVPSSVMAGDILVLLDRAAHSSNTPSTTVPSGFTSLSDFGLYLSGYGHRQTISYKRANGSEASTVLTGMTGDSLIVKILLAFAAGATSLAPSTFNLTAAAGDPAAQTVSASGGTAPLVVLAAYGSYYNEPSHTFSPAKDGEFSSGVMLWLAYRIFNSSPVDVVVDMNDPDPSFNIRNILQSGYIQVA